MLIKCDGPECKREIDSTIHAGTWTTLKEGDIFSRDPRVERPDKHFCSNICLIKFLLNRTGGLQYLIAWL